MDPRRLADRQLAVAARSGGRWPQRNATRSPACRCWKIFDNLRRSLVPAALVLLTLIGWYVAPRASAFTLALAGLVAIPTLLNGLVALLRKPRELGLGRHVSTVGARDRSRTGAVRNPDRLPAARGGRQPGRGRCARCGACSLRAAGCSSGARTRNRTRRRQAVSAPASARCGSPRSCPWRRPPDLPRPSRLRSSRRCRSSRSGSRRPSSPGG